MLQSELQSIKREIDKTVIWKLIQQIIYNAKFSSFRSRISRLASKRVWAVYVTKLTAII